MTKKALTYSPQAFLVWKQAYDTADKLKESKLESARYSKVLKIKGAYQPEAVVSKLFGKTKSSAVSRYFLNLENQKISALVPELKLFRVEGENNSPKPFYFPITADYKFDSNGKVNFKDQSFSAGASAIRSFSYSLTGKNPYEVSKKFLNASLEIYVDNISNLFEAPTGYAELADLFTIRAGGNATSTGNRSVSAQALGSMQSCRITALVGYSVPRTGQFTQEEIKTIEGSNQMVNLFYSGHDLNIQQDGSATVSIKYTGFLQAITSQSFYDLFSTSKTKALVAKKISKTKEISGNINTLLSNRSKHLRSPLEQTRTTVDPFNPEAERETSAAAPEDTQVEPEDVIRAFKSILRNLSENGKIHHTNFNENYFKKKFAATLSDEPKTEPLAVTENSNAITNIFGVFGENRIYYFTFADFLQAYFKRIADTLTQAIKEVQSSIDPLGGDDRTETVKKIYQYLEDLKLFNVLTANVLVTRKEEQASTFTMNIGDIPISVDTLYTLVYDEITKKRLPFYGMTDFLEVFCPKLLSKSMDEFPHAPIIRDLSIKIASFTSRQIKKAVSGEIDIEDVPAPNVASAKSSIKDAAEFIMFYQQPSQYAKSAGRGKQKEDVENGKLHLRVNKDRGLLKNITFSKISMPAREAYLVVSSGNLYDELRIPHNATANMFGNNMFLPGSYVYVDPNTIGFGSPKDLNSAARRLGFGGYYTVENVTTEYSGGKLSTTLKLQFNAFPDVESQPETEVSQQKSINEVSAITRRSS